jgi:hypothetical protein
MKSNSFQIELLGGPADGLQLSADKVPGLTIRMPSSPSARLSDGYGKRGSAGRHWAVYELLWRRGELNGHGAAIVRLGYDFVGCRARQDRSQAKRFVARLLGMTGVAWLKNHSGALRGRLAARRLAARIHTAGTAAAIVWVVGRDDARTEMLVEKQDRLRHP